MTGVQTCALPISAFGVHHFTEGKEDSEAKTPGAVTVYLTDYTPFHHIITIRP